MIYPFDDYKNVYGVMTSKLVKAEITKGIFTNNCFMLLETEVNWRVIFNYSSVRKLLKLRFEVAKALYPFRRGCRRIYEVAVGWTSGAIKEKNIKLERESFCKTEIKTEEMKKKIWHYTFDPVVCQLQNGDFTISLLQFNSNNFLNLKWL